MARLRRMIRLAIRQAELSDMDSRHGAITFSNIKNVISVGFNKPGIRVHSIHAEVDAVSGIKGGCHLLVIRIDGNGKLKNSRPCARCLEAMRMAGIRKVYYSCDDGEIEVEKVKDMESDYISSGQRHYM